MTTEEQKAQSILPRMKRPLRCKLGWLSWHEWADVYATYPYRRIPDLRQCVHCLKKQERFFNYNDSYRWEWWDVK